MIRARHHVRAAFRALPLESLATAAAVASLWCVVASDGGRAASRCFFASVLAVAPLFAVTILRRAERISRRLGHLLAGLAVAGAIGLGATQDALDETFAWRFGLGLLAAVMLPFLAAAVAAPHGRRLLGFADFVRRFSEETTASALLLAAALAAVAVLMGSLGGLFHLHRILGMRVEELGIDLGGGIAGMLVLGYLHRLLPGGPPGRVPELWRRLIARVAAPFLVAMLGILVVYEVWVIGRGELPVNLVSPLIIAAGAIGFASTLVIESLVAVREERILAPAEPHPWTAAGPVRLSRAFAAILLALLPLAMWALWVRIDQHGLTPMRAARAYALGCLALLALWSAVRWLRRRRPLSWEIPALTAVAALVAAVGPLSVVGLSIRSQAARLDQALDRAGVSSRVVQTIAPAHPRAIDRASYLEIADRIGALAGLGGASAVSRVLSGDLEPCSATYKSSDCIAHLGLADADADAESPAGLLDDVPAIAADTRRTVRGESGITREVDGVRFQEIWLGHGSEAPAAMGSMTLSLRGNRLVCRLGDGHLASADLSGSLAGWYASGSLGVIPPLVDEAGCVRGHVFGREASVEADGDGPRLTALDGVWVVPARPSCP